jgi:CBS domain containing-hemolysin-like protein
MTDDISGLWAFAFLLILNAFFVGAEFALIAAKRAQIEPRAEAGSRPAKVTLKAMENVSLMLATAQLGITICSLLILLIVEPSIHHLLESPLAATGLSKELASGVSFGIALALVTFMHVVFGEMVPKNISFSIPERAALVLVPLLYGLAVVFKPVVVTLNAIANVTLKLFGVRLRDEANSVFTLDQVEDIVEHSTREGVLSDASGTLSNTFEFTEKKVRDIAVKLSDVVSFPDTVTPREIEVAVSRVGYSRYPLTDEDGELIGYLHLKDVLDLDLDEMDDAVPTKRIRSLISVPDSMELEDALASMRRVGAHLARVFNRGGQVTGVLFLEDILEELVGEVQDATKRD